MFKVAAGIIVGLITFCSGPLGWALFALIAATWAGIVLSVRATLLLVRISYMVAKLALQAVWGALVVAGRLMLALAVVSLASKALAGRR